MQFTTMITLLFVASAIAAPIAVSSKRQINPVGSEIFSFFSLFFFLFNVKKRFLIFFFFFLVNNFGDDGVPSMSKDGTIVRLADGAATANGKA